MAQLGPTTVSGGLGVTGNCKVGGYLSGKVDCISGQVGSSATFTAPALVPFDDFWVTGRGINYNSSTRRFTVTSSGIYRITFNPFFNTGYGNGRLLVGINTDAPTQANHKGHCYKEASTSDTMCVDSVVQLYSGDYVVFYLVAGSIYNGSSDRFNQFSIVKLGD